MGLFFFFNSSIFNMRLKLASQFLELRVVLEDFMGELKALNFLFVPLEALVNSTLEVEVPAKLSRFLGSILFDLPLDLNSLVDAL